jgi:hypothetical protein
MAKEHQCLVLFLAEEATLGWAERWPIAELSFDGRRYAPVGPSWSGFYDWLRDPEGLLVAIRYEPCEELSQSVSKVCEGLGYVERGNFGDWIFHLGGHSVIDRSKSEEQDFLYDQVFFSEEGLCAIAFANQYPVQVKANIIGSAGVRWVSPSAKYQ